MVSCARKIEQAGMLKMKMKTAREDFCSAVEASEDASREFRKSNTATGAQEEEHRVEVK